MTFLTNVETVCLSGNMVFIEIIKPEQNQLNDFYLTIGMKFPFSTQRLNFQNAL